MEKYEIVQTFFDAQGLSYTERKHADGHKYLSCTFKMKNGPDFTVFIDIKDDETDVLVFDFLDLSEEEDIAPFYKMVCNQNRNFRFANIFVDEDDSLSVCYSFRTPNTVSDEDFVNLVWDNVMSVCRACDSIYMSYMKVKFSS